MTNTTTSRIETYSAEIFTHKWVMLNGLTFQFESLIEDPNVAIKALSEQLNAFVKEEFPPITFATNLKHD